MVLINAHISQPSQLMFEMKGQRSPGCSGELARIVHRLAAAQEDADVLRAKHDGNLLFLTLAAGWVRTWIRDDVIAQWLASRRPAYVVPLKGIVDDADFAIEPRRHMKLPYEPAAGMVATSTVKRRKKRLSWTAGSSGSETADIDQICEAVLVNISRNGRAEIEAQIFAEQSRHGTRRDCGARCLLEASSDIVSAGRKHHPLHHISSPTVRL
ncbi:hypothetical protein OKW29_008054 [Paraburkholderia sp. CI3]